MNRAATVLCCVDWLTLVELIRFVDLYKLTSASQKVNCLFAPYSAYSVIHHLLKAWDFQSPSSSLRPAASLGKKCSFKFLLRKKFFGWFEFLIQFSDRGCNRLMTPFKITLCQGCRACPACPVLPQLPKTNLCPTKHDLSSETNWHNYPNYYFILFGCAETNGARIQGCPSGINI